MLAADATLLASRHASSVRQQERPHRGPHCRGFDALLLTSLLLSLTPSRPRSGVGGDCGVAASRSSSITSPACRGTDCPSVNPIRKGHQCTTIVKSATRWRAAAALALSATVLAALRRRRQRRRRRAAAAPNADTTLTLVAYAVPEPGWSKVIPAFAATEEGKGVAVTTSYGASGDQSRGVGRRQARRHRQLLGRARHHPAGQGRQGRRGLERRRHQGHPVRFGGDPGGAPGQPQEHQGLGRPAAARRRGHHARAR